MPATPNPTSERTRRRATALAWFWGCEQDYPCWDDGCYDAALNAVVSGTLDDADRRRATTSAYWKLTHEAQV